jgi:hypothetical protein
MKNKLVLAGACAALALGVTACGSKAVTITTGNSNASKSSTSSSTGAKSATTKPKTPITDAKKPDNAPTKDVPAAKKVPVPTDWVRIVDYPKGYAFQVPAGSTGDYETRDGVEYYEADTPAPSEVNVEVLVYKDKTLSKDDLLKDATDYLKSLGETVTSTGTLSALSDDYGLFELTSTDSDGKKWKSKVLVATDVTDNYIVIVSSDESKFDGNKEIVDAIWGSFEMFSGGASGNS